LGYNQSPDNPASKLIKIKQLFVGVFKSVICLNNDISNPALRHSAFGIRIFAHSHIRTSAYPKLKTFFHNYALIPHAANNTNSLVIPAGHTYRLHRLDGYPRRSFS
jgi:hypothetical protein